MIEDYPRTHRIAGLALSFDSAQRRLRDISRAEGRTLSLTLEDSDLLGGDDFSGQAAILNWREYLRLGGAHVLGLRLTAGIADSDEGTERLFTLGGEPNGELLAGGIENTLFVSPFNRRDYPLRGYPEDDVAVARICALSVWSIASPCSALSVV